MAFGFGFNKQKTLGAAEKYVQQGKIQNAIAEYEKVIKADPKDLTVTNTIGDLYNRLGDTDKATNCFKTVGDAYASQGFTVKAIAMYKKISKLKPSLESILKLAELYTQQGLFNDARAQYLQVAEEFLKSNELDNAVRIFQKILEMDPENTTMRIRLAEVYVRLGKKDEAWQIFSAAAEALRSKGSLSGAEEVLQRMLTLDPGNSYALLMQGRNLLEAGDSDSAIEALQKVPDLDSNPDGMRDLLKAYLKSGRLSDAGTLAGKLLSVHNDLASISSFADALLQAGQYENALQVYDQHADRLLAEDSAKVLRNLHSIIGHVRENPASLSKLLDLFQKSGETTHLTEVIELLAHASVQAGDLHKARDLYQKLAAMEPGNTLHMNNYQQVVSQLGGPTAEKLISAEEAAVIVDELEATSPSVHQHYSDEVSLSVRSALTDAELFISYNMPGKALGPLMAALPQAPNDLRLNQRLAALHTRAARFAEAGVCCRTLQSVYSDAGYPEEATRYGELADRYEQRSAAPAVGASEIQSSPVEELAIEAPVAEEPAEISIEATAPWPAAPVEAVAEPEFSVMAETPSATTAEEFVVAASAQEPVASEPSEPQEVPTPQAATEEIDLSSEWDDALTVEAEPSASSSAAVAEDPEKTAETIEEIRFYLEHGMPEQATAAFEKLQTFTSNVATIESLRAEIATGSQPAAAVEEVTAVEDITEFSAEEPPEITIEEVSQAVEVNEPAFEIPHGIGETIPAEAAVEETPIPALHAETPAAAWPVEPVVEASVEPEPIVAHAPQSVAQPSPEPAPAPGILQEFVSDLESSLGDSFLTGAVPHEPALESASTELPRPNVAAEPALEPVGQAAPTSFGVAEPEVMGEFVADLEASLGPDFLKDAPVPEPAAAVSQQAAPATPLPAKTASPIAASAAAGAGAGSAAFVPPAPQQSTATIVPPKPQTSPIVPGAPSAVKSSPFTADAGVDLAEMFGDLKQDLEAGVASNDEDPETHYNLGIAFREMGLLDEAIGELQKTCQAVDRGHPFTQVIQTYTWLAQCFLDKGVPEAAIRWYQKALTAPTVDEETRTALYYEMASAYEAAGDKPSALKNFMEVYGRNIDYRDVAERIKPLKS